MKIFPFCLSADAEKRRRLPPSLAAFGGLKQKERRKEDCACPAQPMRAQH